MSERSMFSAGGLVALSMFSIFPLIILLVGWIYTCYLIWAHQSLPSMVLSVVFLMMAIEQGLEVFYWDPVDSIASFPAPSWAEIPETIAHVLMVMGIPVLHRYIRQQSSLQRLEQQLQEQQYRDDLTGLLTRTMFETVVDGHLQDDHQPMALLFMDLNNFKEINDRFGHSAGDKVLKTIANRLDQCLRSDDFLCRFGGDEFVMLVRNVKLKKQGCV